MAVYRWWRRKYIARQTRRLYQSLGSLGQRVRFEEGVQVMYPERLEVGSNVLIHRGAFIDAEGGVKIGDNFVAAQNLVILSSTHNYEVPDLLPWDERKHLKPAIIEDNIWCGMNVIILPGVRIGEGAVIGAGSVVTRDVYPCAVVDSNPAKCIKFWDVETYNRLKREGKFLLHPITDLTSDILLRRTLLWGGERVGAHDGGTRPLS